MEYGIILPPQLTFPAYFLSPDLFNLSSINFYHFQSYILCKFILYIYYLHKLDLTNGKLRFNFNKFKLDSY